MLFRKEVLEHKKTQVLGKVLISQPPYFGVWVGGCVVIAIAILLLLILGGYARKETVEGLLVPDQGVVKIYAPHSGFVRSVMVQEGSTVQQGQALMQLGQDRTLDSGEELGAVSLTELTQSIQSLEQQKEQERTFLGHQQEALTQQIAQTEQERHRIELQIDAQMERVRLARERNQTAQKLAEQAHLSTDEVRIVYEKMLDTEQGLQNLERQRTHLERDLQKLTFEKDHLPHQVQTRIYDLERQLSSLRQQKARMNLENTHVLVSPIAGIVTSVQAKTGQFERAGQAALLAIIPEGSVLEAEVYVPTRAVGFLQKGQSVRIRYAAFPYQKFGVFEGKIHEIGHTILQPQEVSATQLSGQSGPVYRVIIHIDHQAIEAYGKAFPLQAGMTLQADILLQRRSLWEYLLDPIMSLRGVL